MAYDFRAVDVIPYDMDPRPEFSIVVAGLADG